MIETGLLYIGTSYMIPSSTTKIYESPKSNLSNRVTSRFARTNRCSPYFRPGCHIGLVTRIPTWLLHRVCSIRRSDYADAYIRRAPQAASKPPFISTERMASTTDQSKKGAKGTLLSLFSTNSSKSSKTLPSLKDSGKAPPAAQLSV